jgi:hypothetical protein
LADNSPQFIFKDVDKLEKKFLSKKSPALGLLLINKLGLLVCSISP